MFDYHPNWYRPEDKKSLGLAGLSFEVSSLDTIRFGKIETQDVKGLGNSYELYRIFGEVIPKSIQFIESEYVETNLRAFNNWQRGLRWDNKAREYVPHESTVDDPLEAARNTPDGKAMRKIGFDVADVTLEGNDVKVKYKRIGEGDCSPCASPPNSAPSTTPSRARPLLSNLSDDFSGPPRGTHFFSRTHNNVRSGIRMAGRLGNRTLGFLGGASIALSLQEAAYADDSHSRNEALISAFNGMAGFSLPLPAHGFEEYPGLLNDYAHGVPTLGSTTGIPTIDLVVPRHMQDQFRGDSCNREAIRAAQIIRNNDTSGGLGSYLGSLEYWMRGIAGF
jgi:hypothetical protein